MTQLSEIYNQRILELSAHIPRAERLPDANATATAHSKLCGSTVTVDLKLTGDRVTAYGQTVKACLLGQAAASVMAHNILGADAQELREVGAAMRKMLKAHGPPPAGRWADLAVLEPVKDYKARHASTLLVFDAVEMALAAAEARQAAPDGAPAAPRSAAPGVAEDAAMGSVLARAAQIVAKSIAKAPIHAYRWTLKPLIGLECRHLPTCSEYALEAIDRNGAWRGSWLTLSRICRCHPWGTHGFDPVPDISALRHPLAPWRYGRWRLAPSAPRATKG